MGVMEMQYFTSGLLELREAPREQQKQLMGERLLPLVHSVQPLAAGKVTGMLLELDNDELFNLLASPAALHAKIMEALSVLQMNGDIRMEERVEGVVAYQRVGQPVAQSPGRRASLDGRRDDYSRTTTSYQPAPSTLFSTAEVIPLEDIADEFSDWVTCADASGAPAPAPATASEKGPPPPVFSITVPAGMTAGRSFEAVLDGRASTVTVPDGAGPGFKLHVRADGTVVARSKTQLRAVADEPERKQTQRSSACALM